MQSQTESSAQQANKACRSTKATFIWPRLLVWRVCSSCSLCSRAAMQGPEKEEKARPVSIKRLYFIYSL